jgi:hypothetical protein
VKPVQRVGMKKCIKKTGTPDIGNNNDLFSTQAHILKGLVKAMGNPFMGATRTKYRRPAGIQ